MKNQAPHALPQSLNRFLERAKREAGFFGEVNIRITSNAEMRRFNRQFRGKNKPTDVLSFPAEPPIVAGGGFSAAVPRDGRAGDIAISAEMARANAKTLGHSFEDEVKILLVHGLLHLAGHDHERDNGEMRSLEQKLRAKLNLPTGLIERSEGGNPVLERNHRSRRA